MVGLHRSVYGILAKRLSNQSRLGFGFRQIIGRQQNLYLNRIIQISPGQYVIIGRYRLWEKM